MVNSDLTVSGDGGLTLNTNQGGTGGTLSFGPGASASFTNPSSDDGQKLVINGGNYQLIRQNTDLSKFVASYDSDRGVIDGRFALVDDISAGSATASLPINTIIDPVGLARSVDFVGTFNGLGHTIDGLKITSQVEYGGLFGRVNGATIESLRLTNLDVRSAFTGDSDTYVGGVAGQALNSRIFGVTVNGAVSNESASSERGFSYTGGLIGQSNGSVVQSSSSAGTVRGGGARESETGGLIGHNAGTGSITQSSSSSNVTGSSAGGVSSDTGGLVGWNTSSGSLSEVSATGAVTGGNSTSAGSSSFTGGLVGFDTGSGSIDEAIALGPVQGGNAGNRSLTGGLIGYNLSASIARAYANGAVTGGSASNNGVSYTGGLIGSNGGSLDQVYATGRVTAGTASNASTGGLMGFNASNADGQGPSGGTVNASFWDLNTTGQNQAAGNVSNLAGATGLTTAQFQDPNFFVPLASAQGWDFQTVWSPPRTGVYPQLYSLSGQPPQQQDQATTASEIANATVTPNLTTIFPNFSTTVLPLADAIDISAGGPTLGSGIESGGSQTRAGAQAALVSVQRASNTLESEVAACDKNNKAGLQGTTTCYSNALDRFADTLDVQAQQLPPAFRSLPAVIRQAARQVRAAKTVTEVRAARAAVRVAVVAVRKAISLLRADDPAVARIQVRQGNAIGSALRTVENRLSRAVGL